MAKRRTSFYDKPFATRMSQRVLESLLTTAAVYFLSPRLLVALSPIQAQINADAINNGLTPSNQGANAPANALIALVPDTQTNPDYPKVGS